jgi:hypothetical protein
MHKLAESCCVICYLVCTGSFSIMLVPTGSSKLTALHSELYSTVDIIVFVCVF